MKKLVLILSLVFTAGLLVAGQALGAGPAGHYLLAQNGNGVAIHPGQMENPTAAVPLNEEQVRHMQQILKDNGYEVGEEDGTIGPQTTNAIEEFQGAQGLTVNGVPNQETLRALSPSSETQEYFGLSPAFGQQTPSQQQPMEEEQQSQPRHENGGSY